MRYFDGLGGGGHCTCPTAREGWRVRATPARSRTEVIRQARASGEEDSPPAMARRRAGSLGGDPSGRSGRFSGRCPAQGESPRSRRCSLDRQAAQESNNDYAVARAEVMTLRPWREVGIDALASQIS